MSSSGTLRETFAGSRDIESLFKGGVRPPQKSQIQRNPRPTQETASSEEETASSEEETASSEEETASSDAEREEGTDQTGLSTMSFEELIHIRERAGTKHQRTPLGKEQGGALASSKRPLEMSSKAPVSFLRKVLPAPSTMRRDPRFDDLSGEYRAEAFEKSYSFLSDIKKREKEEVEKKLKKTRNPQLRQQLEQLLHRMDQQEKAAQRRIKLRETEKGFKREQLELARQGKRPFYLKRGDLRKMELADRYQELKKKKGKLEQFLSKKRKRNQMKDRRRLPNN